MIRLRTIRSVFAAIVVTCIGCAEQPVFEVGTHALSVNPSKGWQHANHGSQHVWRKDFCEIHLQDLGPVNRDGYLDAVTRAHALFENGREADALDRLKQLSLPEYAFDEREAWKTFYSSRTRVQRARERNDRVVEATAYNTMLEVVGGMRELSLDDVADRALNSMGHDKRRDIASKRHVQIGDRDGLIVDTWDRTTHNERQRFALVFNRGCLFVMRTGGGGAFEDASEEFDTMLRSVRFVENVN